MNWVDFVLIIIVLLAVYFSHVTPDGKDPFDRMKANDIHFITAGENITLAQTISIVQYGFRHSPGHRANI